MTVEPAPTAEESVNGQHVLGLAFVSQLPAVLKRVADVERKDMSNMNCIVLSGLLRGGMHGVISAGHRHLGLQSLRHVFLGPLAEDAQEPFLDAREAVVVLMEEWQSFLKHNIYMSFRRRGPGRAPCEESAGGTKP